MPMTQVFGAWSNDDPVSLDVPQSVIDRTHATVGDLDSFWLILPIDIMRLSSQYSFEVRLFWDGERMRCTGLTELRLVVRRINDG